MKRTISAIVGAALAVAGLSVPEPAVAVVDGVTVDDVPSWYVQIRRTDLGGPFWCSGALVAREWVLTAAHCVREPTPTFEDVVAPQRLVLYIGGSEPQGAAAVAEVDRIRTKWPVPGDTGGVVEDIALVHIAAGTVLPAGTGPLPLVTAPWTATESSDIYFWGSGVGGPVLTTAQGDWDIRDYDDCWRQGIVCYEANDGATTIPAAGDSGGPVTAFVDGSWVQFGIFSGPGPDPDDPGNLVTQYGADTLYYEDWIRRITGLPRVRSNSVVRDVGDGAAWHVDISGFRSRVPTQEDVDCLVGLGAPLVELSSFEVQTLPESVGEQQECDPGGEPPPDLDFCGGALVTIAGEGRIRGTPGNDVVLGSAGPDDIIGGGGDDRICGAGGDDRLVGADGDDTVLGAAGVDTISGGPGDDVMFGGDGDDDQQGGDGADEIHSEAGADTSNGGEGDDQLYGGDEADRLTGAGGHDQLYGHGGADTLDGNAGNDQLYGGDDGDGLGGGAGDDELYGEAGDDVLSAHAGDDELYGGAGDDVLSVDAGDDELYGEAGDDSLAGGGDNDELYGGSGNNSLAGGEGNDQLYGDDGADVLTGGAGDDQLYAGGGNDTLNGQPGADILYGGDGDDHLTSRDRVQGNDHVDGESGIDVVVSDPGDVVVDTS